MAHLKDLQREAWWAAEEKGFHNPRVDETITLSGPDGLSDGIPFIEGCAFRKTSPIERLMLIVSEAAEAMECVRDGADLTKNTIRADGKPEGFPSEVADIVIRCMDLAEDAGFDLEDAITEKMDYNYTREFMHGKKL